MFFLYAILFLLFGYAFILSLLKAMKDEVSHHLVAILFIIWASSAILVTVSLVSL